MTGLQGTHVRLRALTLADQPQLRAFINDPEVLQASNAYRPISDVQQDRWFEAMVSDPSVSWFGIDVLEPEQIIGTCCLVDIDWISRVAELRIRIGDRNAWGKSYGTEACSLLVSYGFKHLNLERIWLRVFASNERALRMYKRLGFIEEGRLRRAWHIDGRTEDVVVMGLLWSEWRPT